MMQTVAQKESWLQNLRDCYDVYPSIHWLFRLAALKLHIAMMITNLSRGDGT